MSATDQDPTEPSLTGDPASAPPEPPPERSPPATEKGAGGAAEFGSISLDPLPPLADEPPIAAAADDPSEAPYVELPEPALEASEEEKRPSTLPPPGDSPDASAPDIKPPGIANFRPAKASTEGGTIVTVFGGGFQEGCRVWIENLSVAAELVDAFCVRFEAPAHPAGAASLELENPDGLRSRSSSELVYARGPLVLDVHPYEVPPEGGVEITVEGEDFADGCALSLFGVHAPVVTLDGPTLLRFTAPPVGDGPYEGSLSITNPDGLMCRIDHSIIYRALSPCIDVIEPASGYVSGGKAIELRGADFHRACRARFGDRPSEVRFKSSTLLEVVVPPGADVGPIDVVVENPDGSAATSEGGFVYEPVPAPPKIISLVPNAGSTVGGLIVRVFGDNFTEATKIRFGEVTAVARVLSTKIIEAELPPRAFPGVVSVEAADAGVTVRAEGAFTYASPKAPKVTSVDPPAGPATGGTKVVIEGEGFPPNATVRIGREAPKHIAIKGPTSIEIVTPPSRHTGFVDIEVSSPETGPGAMKNGFRYDAVPAPTLISVAPNRGGTGGGTELTVEGKNFAEGATVSIGKKPAKRVRRISGSILEVITPEGDDGDMVDVVVKNPDGREAISKRAFQYDARYRG